MASPYDDFQAPSPYAEFQAPRPKTEEPPGALSRLGTGLYESTIKPAVDIGSRLLSNPGETIKNVGKGMLNTALGTEDLGNAYQEIKSGHLVAGLIHGGQSLLEGPEGRIGRAQLEPIGEDIKEGNLAGAAGRTIGTVGPIFAPKIIPPIGRGASGMASSALDVATHPVIRNLTGLILPQDSYGLNLLNRLRRSSKGINPEIAPKIRPMPVIGAQSGYDAIRPGVPELPDPASAGAIPLEPITPRDVGHAGFIRHSEPVPISAGRPPVSLPRSGPTPSPTAEGATAPRGIVSPITKPIIPSSGLRISPEILRDELPTQPHAPFAPDIHKSAATVGRQLRGEGTLAEGARGIQGPQPSSAFTNPSIPAANRIRALGIAEEIRKLQQGGQ